MANSWPAGCLDSVAYCSPIIRHASLFTQFFFGMGSLARACSPRRCLLNKLRVSLQLDKIFLLLTQHTTHSPDSQIPMLPSCLHGALAGSWSPISKTGMYLLLSQSYLGLSKSGPNQEDGGNQRESHAERGFVRVLRDLLFFFFFWNVSWVVASYSFFHRGCQVGFIFFSLYG